MAHSFFLIYFIIIILEFHFDPSHFCFAQDKILVNHLSCLKSTLFLIVCIHPICQKWWKVNLATFIFVLPVLMSLYQALFFKPIYLIDLYIRRRTSKLKKNKSRLFQFFKFSLHFYRYDRG